MCMCLGANTFCWVPICISNFRYLKSLGIKPLAKSFSYSQASHITPRGDSSHECWSPLVYLVHSACAREEEGVGRAPESSLKEKNSLEEMTAWGTWRWALLVNRTHAGTLSGRPQFSGHSVGVLDNFKSSTPQCRASYSWTQGRCSAIWV